MTFLEIAGAVAVGALIAIVIVVVVVRLYLGRLLRKLAEGASALGDAARRSARSPSRSRPTCT